jgi:hypothetical protein
MAAERSKRANAGAKMNQLLEAEDEDDFYKTTYGGFEEVGDTVVLLLVYFTVVTNNLCSVQLFVQSVLENCINTSDENHIEMMKSNSYSIGILLHHI